MGWVLHVGRVLWGEVLDDFVERDGFAVECLVDGVCNIRFMEDVMEWGGRSWLEVVGRLEGSGGFVVSCGEHCIGS